LRLFLDLGTMPLVDDLPLPDAPPDPVYPLRVAVCEACFLVQILESPPPQVLFPEDYPYFSSFSSDYLAHADRFVAGAVERLQLGPGSQVLEVASNDGYLLRGFVARGVPVLGIDPAPGPVAAALAAGIPTRLAFFEPGLAEELRSAGLRADLVVANNVLAHVPDPNVLLRAMAVVLKPQGQISIEVPYVLDLIENNEFDTIYHEHHCYFSVSSLQPLLARAGLSLLNVERIPVHGGSLRVSAGFGPTDPVVREFLERERAAGITAVEWYQDFAGRVARTGRELLDLLGALRRKGARIAAYGAAAKGVVLLNHLGIGADTCEFVVDRNPRKQGRLLPGVRIPVLAPEALIARKPDYVLLLPWNWADEIIGQQNAYVGAGGRFIIPIPYPRLQPAETTAR
jgi:SAM-dependent methyltransferase